MTLHLRLSAPAILLLVISFGFLTAVGVDRSALLGAGVAIVVLIALSALNRDEGPAPERPAPSPATGATAAMTGPGPLWEDDRFAATLDALPVPVLLIDGEDRVAVANRAARALLGGFIVGTDVRAAIRHPAAADLLAQRHQDAARSMELVGLGGAGRRWRMAVSEVGDGRLVQLTDESQRDAVERMRADFVANASHELRTPLAAILGFVETLSDEDAGGDPATRERFLGVIDTEARRMTRLVDDLLSISRIEASKGSVPGDTLDLCELVEEVVTQHRRSTRSVRARDLALSCDPPTRVQGDRAQLLQMIDNIVANALKYGRAGTPVTVRVGAAAGSMIELTVADQGDGIPRHALPRLTERFYRVDSARSRKLGGTGLGLAIVKHIVERHRGRLDIESEQGVGTQVRIRLPAAADEDQG